MYLMTAITMIIATSCERVAPNFAGVLMENYGKSGKGDYSKVIGRVNTMAPGSELWQVPLYEQRADFEDRVLHLKAADNTEFTAKPLYTYKAIENRVVDLVFQNTRLGSGDEFMKAMEDNILEPTIYDIIKEASRTYSTDTLMVTGGSLRFEQRVQELVKIEFEKRGLELINFSSNLDFTDKVKNKINERNEVNTNVSVLDQQILEYDKKIILARKIADYNKTISEGLTDEILIQQFIGKWDGKTPLYGSTPLNLLKTVK